MTAGEELDDPGGGIAAIKGIGGPATPGGGTATATCGATSGGAEGRAEGVVRDVGPAERDCPADGVGALPAAARCLWRC